MTAVMTAPNAMAIHLSALRTASPAFESAAAFAKRVASEQSRIDDATSSLHRIELWLIAFSVLVFIGLAVESWDDVSRFFNMQLRERGQWYRAPREERSWYIAVTLLGAFLILVGICGEIRQTVLADEASTRVGVEYGNMFLLLRMRADEASAAAVAAVNAAGGLQKYVHDNAAKIEFEIGRLNAARVKGDVALGKIPKLEESEAKLAARQASAETRLGGLANESNYLGLGLDKARRDLMAAQNGIAAVSPRIVLDQPLLVDELKKFGGTTVWVTGAREGDAPALADSISDFLGRAGWGSTRMPEDGRTFFWGIEIEYWSTGKWDEKLTPEQLRSRAAGAFLCEELTARGLTASTRQVGTGNDEFWNPTVPKEALLVRVGTKEALYFQNLNGLLKSNGRPPFPEMPPIEPDNYNPYPLCTVLTRN